MTSSAPRLTPAGHPVPLGWDDMGSSARDLYDERMGRAQVRSEQARTVSHYRIQGILFRAAGFATTDRRDAETRAKWATGEVRRATCARGSQQTAILTLVISARSEGDALAYAAAALRSTGHAHDSIRVISATPKG